MNPRKYAAMGVVKQCNLLGVALIAMATGIHAVPIDTLKRYPNLIGMVQRYRQEIAEHLDTTVE